MEATIRLEHHLLAVEDEHTVHAMLNLKAPPAPAGPRPPLNLALVIDRSGSMAGPKLEVTKRCAAYLIRRLASTDRLAVVAYDDEVTLPSPLAPVRPDLLLPVVGSIPPGGSTNLSGGWLKGLEELRRAPAEGTRSILLLTDGQANVGIVETPALVEMARRARAEGIGTTTIGFGEDFAEDLLTGMADAGGGNAHYAATPDEAPAIFAEEFEGLVSLVAQNVSAEIRPADEVKMLGVLNEYPHVPVPGGVQVQLGDAYAEDERRVVFELHVPEMSRLGPARVAEIVIRYVSVGAEIAAHEVTLPITVNLVSADEAAATEADHEVSEEVVVLKAARAQEEARQLASAGEFDQARELLASAAEQLRSTAKGSDRADELLEQVAFMEGADAAMTPATFDPSVSKAMLYRARGTQRKRGRPRSQLG